MILLPEGRVLWIELKSEKGSLREDQKKLMLKWAFLGHKYNKVRSFKQFLTLAAKENEDENVSDQSFFGAVAGR